MVEQNDLRLKGALKSSARHRRSAKAGGHGRPYRKLWSFTADTRLAWVSQVRAGVEVLTKDHWDFDHNLLIIGHAKQNGDPVPD